jgi:hypothetical protein
LIAAYAQVRPAHNRQSCRKGEIEMATKKITKIDKSVVVDEKEVNLVPGEMPPVPKFLQRKENDVSGHRTLSSSAAVEAPKRKSFGVPAGMTQEEYDAVKAKLDPKPEKPAKEPKAKKVTNPRPKAAHGTFTAADWGRANNKDPRHVRRILRAHKEAFLALQATPDSKYIYPDSNEAKFAKLVNESLAGESKKVVKKGETPAPKKERGKGTAKK